MLLDARTRQRHGYCSNNIVRCMMDVHSLPCGQAAPSLQCNSYFHHLKWTTAENDTVHHFKKIGKLCAMLSAFYTSEVATTATTWDWEVLCSQCSGQSSTQGGVHETHEAHEARCMADLIQSLLYIKLYHGILLLQFVCYKMIYNPWKMCVDFLLSRRQA